MQMRQYAGDRGGRGGRRRRAFGVAMLAAATALAGSAAAGAKERDHEKHEHGGAYEIGLWGDLPYSTAQATIGVPNLIADMNAQGGLFTVHDGDLKTGNGAPVCDDNLYSQALATLQHLRAPAMFTPGDNEWTDCDRPKNGGFNSLERLTHERQVFFGTPFSLGQHRLRQQVQTEPLCLGVTDLVTLTTIPVPCVENRRWIGRREVIYRDAEHPGLLQQPVRRRTRRGRVRGPQRGEHPLDAGDLRRGQRPAREAVMFISQADPGFSESEFDAPQRDPQTSRRPTAIPTAFRSSWWRCGTR